MTTWGARVASLALSALALAGCEDDHDDTESDASAPTSHIFEPEVVDSGSGGDGDDASAPVLDLEQGAHTTTTFEIAMTFSVDNGATGTIPITVTTDTKVLDVGDTFDRVRTTISDIAVDATNLDPQRVGELTTSLDQAEGFVIDRQLSPYGGVLRADFPRDDVGARDALQFFANVPGFPEFGLNVTSLPSEPIGPGAVWRKDVAYLRAGTPEQTTMEYTLTDLDGSDYRLAFDASGDDEDSDGSFSVTGVVRGSLTMAVPVSVTGDSSETSVQDINGTATQVTTDIHVEATTR